MMCEVQKTNRDSSIPALIAKLEMILLLLDQSGHRISAIKVEEAISALKEDQQKLATKVSPIY
jgi:hypothetical protein